MYENCRIGYDRIFMKKEYEDGVRNGRFVKGSTYLNVIDHEVMHLKKNKRQANMIINKFYNTNKDKNDILTFISENISLYATNNNELASELNVLKNVNIKLYNKLLFGKE